MSFCCDEDDGCCCPALVQLCSLLWCNPDDVSVKDAEKRTPLHAAAFLGDAEIAELLILSGTTSSGFLVLFSFNI